MSLETGFIQLHRKMIEWEWYTDSNTKSLFIHCLFKANYKDKTFRGIKIRRGSFLTSLPSLAQETGLTIQNVRTSIKRLVLTGELTDKQSSKGRIITVIQYNDYQKLTGLVTVNQQANQHKTNRQANREVTDHSLSTVTLLEDYDNVTNRQANREVTDKLTATNKYNNIKEDNKLSSKIKINFDDINNFEDLFQYWNENKKGGKYKNQKSYNIAFNKLKKLTEEDFTFAKEVIENSIANNYQGFARGNELFMKKTIIKKAPFTKFSNGTDPF